MRFNRASEMYHRSYEDQQHRASGLNLIVAAIALWNTVHLDRAVTTMREQGIAVPEEYLRHLSPLHWDHILLSGDYHRHADRYLHYGGGARGAGADRERRRVCGVGGR